VTIFNLKFVMMVYSFKNSRDHVFVAETDNGTSAASGETEWIQAGQGWIFYNRETQLVA